MNNAIFTDPNFSSNNDLVIPREKEAVLFCHSC